MVIFDPGWAQSGQGLEQEHMPGPLGLPAAPSEAEFLEGVPSLLCWDTGSATVSHSWACGDSTLLVGRLWLLKASGPGVCAGAGLSHPQTLKPCPGITVYRVRPWRGSRAAWSGSGAQYSGLIPPAQCTVPSALALGLCSLLGAPGPGGREGGWPLWGRDGQAVAGELSAGEAKVHGGQEDY